MVAVKSPGTATPHRVGLAILRVFLGGFAGAWIGLLSWLGIMFLFGEPSVRGGIETGPGILFTVVLNIALCIVVGMLAGGMGGVIPGVVAGVVVWVPLVVVPAILHWGGPPAGAGQPPDRFSWAWLVGAVAGSIVSGAACGYLGSFLQPEPRAPAKRSRFSLGRPLAITVVIALALAAVAMIPVFSGRIVGLLLFGEEAPAVCFIAVHAFLITLLAIPIILVAFAGRRRRPWLLGFIPCLVIPVVARRSLIDGVLLCCVYALGLFMWRSFRRRRGRECRDSPEEPWNNF